HLVLLCKNLTGYRNLMYLVSKGFTEGFYNKPRVDAELLASHTEGLIGLSACLAGHVPQLLLAGDYDGAKQAAEKYAAMFAPGDFYIEIQNHGLADQRQIMPSLARIAKECGLGLVATNDCHYLRREEAEHQAILMCIQTNTSIDEGRPLGFETDEFYYKSTEEMERLFSAYPEAIENTVRVAEKCNLELNFDAVHLPHFPCPRGLSSVQYLRELTEAGLTRRQETGMLGYGASGDVHPVEEYRARMDFELSVIESMGYADYFLIVADYVNFAKGCGIPVGPGRGSGAGSLVAFLLGITDVDSIAFDLLFERFLNPERVSMPDIDMDFCYNRRGEVIDYVVEKYGPEHVCQIVTFGTLAARAAIRDVGRALGMPYSAVDPVARAVPQELGITIEKALKLPDLKHMYAESAQVRRLVDTAMALEGMPRNMSVHAAGILITEQPLFDFVPLAVSNEAVVCQYDMDIIAKLGLLKFDFLGLRYLTICHDAERQIRESDPSFSLDSISLTDQATYHLISSGDTGGVFQLESGGMRQMLSELRPSSIDDVQAAIALYRPGPMDSIPTYIENRHHPEKVTYATPELKPILESTYGCVVYQEQVMNIFRTVAGYSFGHADIVRRAMSKKKADVLEAEREDFLAGAEKNGISREIANSLFDDMSDFANYAFNKSHAASYALISYRTAYLKAHHPREYLAALLTSVLGNIPKTGEYIDECHRRGITVCPPNINESFAQFHADANIGGIRFGLGALKNIGVGFIDAVVRERQTGGAFTSLDDFVTRMSAGELNKRQLEALIKAGAFDGLGGINRRQMLSSYEHLMDMCAERSRGSLVGQLDMFAAAPTQGAGSVAGFDYPNLPDFSLKEKLTQEKEASGMYFSGQMLDNYSSHIATLPVGEISALLEQNEAGDFVIAERTRVCVAGMINSVTPKMTRKDERMAFFTLEDRYAEIECLAFPKIYESYGECVRPDTAVCVWGTVSYRENEDPKLLVDKIQLLVDNDAYVDVPPASEEHHAPRQTPVSQSTPVRAVGDLTGKKLYLRLPDHKGLLYRKAMALIEIFEGNVPVVLYDGTSKTYQAYRGGIALSDYLLGEFVRLLGEHNVILK
ncbi:MAG: DNA polymerase III subunit alpha, partial [Clostridia bacterium]|nr:DNA polymerase III subunit alpha [Clostridia bacterium]